MKNLLVLFAKGFPYGTSEPFLENEYPLYRNYYDKVLIITACRRGELPTRQLNDPIIEILPDYTLSKDLISIIQAIPWLLVDKMFYLELRKLFKNGFKWRRFYNILVPALCGNHRALVAYRWIKRHSGFRVNVLYSYWLQIPAHAVLRLEEKLGDKNIRTISRCHGFDIYSERHKDSVIPFQDQYINKIDYIAAASKDGARYLIKKYGHKEKIFTWYLGAADKKGRNPYSSREPFRIVSCARVVPVKRLARIVDALSLIEDISLRWTHIGGGDGFESLVSYSNDRLSHKHNVEVLFLGNVSNRDIYQYYQIEPFHVFISVSESEGGAPISICEALSFGMPVIATAVGGQPETVTDGFNGFLLDKDFKDEELVAQIYKMAKMKETDYASMRASSRSMFEAKFNAYANNTKFITSVLFQNDTFLKKELE